VRQHESGLVLNAQVTRKLERGTAFAPLTKMAMANRWSRIGSLRDEKIVPLARISHKAEAA
jgi:hypothetical protein